MNVGSLFAGIGGFDLGLERAGFEIAWQVEIDPYCRAILERHFPGARRFEDVREIGAGGLAPVDVLCGGFPCQDLSTAGKGAGIDGARSGLWGEFARLVRELGPRYVLVENVPALLTGKGKRWDRAPIGRVLGDLAEVGYDAEWACLSAREFGAPHLRKRVWIVAYPDRADRHGPHERGQEGHLAPLSRRGGAPGPGGTAAEGDRRAASGDDAGGGAGGGQEGTGADPYADPRRLPLVSELDGGSATGREARPRRKHPDRLRDALPDADGGGRPQGILLGAGPGERAGPGDALGRGQLAPPHQWAVEPDVGRVADGVPRRVDRLAALGNALVPQIAEWLGRRILEFEEAALKLAPRGEAGGDA